MSSVEMRGDFFFKGGWLFAVGGVCLDARGRRRRNRGGEGR